MIEVEVKLPLKNREAALQKLTELGFFQGSLIREEDHYYTAKHHDFRGRDEALRVRMQENLSTGSRNHQLTWKGPKLDSVSMARREIETGVEDGSKVDEILSRIGFTSVLPVIKTRQYLLKDYMTACVDEVEELGSFLELELLAEEGESQEAARESALKEIEKTLQRIGYSMADTTRTSYLTMLMEQADAGNAKQTNAGKTKPDKGGIVRLKPECIGCLAGKYLNAYDPDAPYETILEYHHRTLEIFRNAEITMAAPVLVRNINDVHEELFGSRIGYSHVKSHFNQLVLKMEAAIWQQILAASDPLLRAIQYAILGNYIDFAALANVDEKEFMEMLARADELQLDQKCLALLKSELLRVSNRGKLLYLVDNCGEIVFDKLLIRLLKQYYPMLQIQAMVRGGETQNDATMEDAVEIGLDKECSVLSNGNNVAGTWFPELSEEARIAMEEADVILSKGQANLETTMGSGRNTFYLFLCKCHMLSRTFGVARLSPMLIHESLNMCYYRQ